MADYECVHKNLLIDTVHSFIQVKHAKSKKTYFACE